MHDLIDLNRVIRVWNMWNFYGNGLDKSYSSHFSSRLNSNNMFTNCVCHRWSIIWCEGIRFCCCLVAKISIIIATTSICNLLVEYIKLRKEGHRIWYFPLCCIDHWEKYFHFIETFGQSSGILSCRYMNLSASFTIHINNIASFLSNVELWSVWARHFRIDFYLLFQHSAAYHYAPVIFVLDLL